MLRLYDDVSGDLLAQSEVRNRARWRGLFLLKGRASVVPESVTLSAEIEGQEWSMGSFELVGGRDCRCKSWRHDRERRGHQSRRAHRHR